MLTQIIVEEEGKGRAMLPTSFLRQLIGFYGDSLQSLVPRYLEQTMGNFARQQQQMRSAMQQTMGNFLPFSLEEVGRQNMAMMERAMNLFSPFYRGQETGQSAQSPTADGPASEVHQEVMWLRGEVERLRAELDSVRDKAAEARPAAATRPKLIKP